MIGAPDEHRILVAWSLQGPARYRTELSKPVTNPSSKLPITSANQASNLQETMSALASAFSKAGRMMRMSFAQWLPYPPLHSKPSQTFCSEPSCPELFVAAYAQGHLEGLDIQPRFELRACILQHVTCQASRSVQTSYVD